MFHSVAQIHDVNNFVSMSHKPVRKKTAMAPPPKPLGTKDGHPFGLAQCKQLFHPFLEFFGKHVISIVAETRGVPSFVGRSLA